MRGVYREIAAPERLVYTEAFDDYPGRVGGHRRSSTRRTAGR